MTYSGEGLANVKLKWLCFPSSRITEQNLIWYVEKLQCKFIPAALFPFPYLFPLPLPFPRHSHCHSRSHGNPMGPMGSQLFPFPCTSLHRRRYQSAAHMRFRISSSSVISCTVSEILRRKLEKTLFLSATVSLEGLA